MDLIIATADINREIMQGMLSALGERLKQSPGFISHANGPRQGGGWQVVELWESKEDFERWYEASVRPNLPPGVEVEIEHYEIETLLTTVATASR